MLTKPTNSIFVALFAVLFFTIFSFTLTIMGSLYIAGDLGGSNDIAIYTVCFYGLGNAIGIPLGRSLAHRVGTVKLLYISLHLFALCSLLCGLATSFPLFLLFRFIQGFVAGPIYALNNQLFAGLVPAEKKSLFGTISLALFSTVPILGACWGGWIAYDFHWRFAFFGNVLFVMFLAEYIRIKLNNYQPPIEAREFDGIGYFFYAVGIFCVGFVIITGQEFDWFRSHMLIAFLLVGTVCTLFFIQWSLYHPYPLIDFTLFKKPLFTYGIVNLACLFSAYFGIVVLLAFWLSLYVNYTPIWVGTLLGVMVVAGGVQSLLIGRWLARVDARIPLALALICLTISCFHTTIFNEYIDFERIALSRIIAGFGLVFFLPPIFRLCFHSYSEEHTIAVVEIFQVVRALACSLGVISYITLWQRRQAFYHDRLGGTLTAFSEKTQTFFKEASFFHIKGRAADLQLNNILDRQAISLALDDCFFLMGWIMIGLLLLLTSTIFWHEPTFIPERNNVVGK